MEGITVKEGAALTGWNEEYLRRLIRQGKVQAGRFGTIYLIDTHSLLAYTEEQRSDGNENTGPQA